MPALAFWLHAGFAAKQLYPRDIGSHASFDRLTVMLIRINAISLVVDCLDEVLGGMVSGKEDVNAKM